MKHCETLVRNVMRKKNSQLWFCIYLYVSCRKSKVCCNHFLILLRHTFLMHHFNYNRLKKIQKIITVANIYCTLLCVLQHHCICMEKPDVEGKTRKFSHWMIKMVYFHKLNKFFRKHKLKKLLMWNSFYCISCRTPLGKKERRSP